MTRAANSIRDGGARSETGFGWPAAILASAVLSTLTGCSSIGGILGGAAGVTSGSATGNPGVGVAVGIGVKTAVDASLKTYSRWLSREEQGRIAAALGAMQVGETRTWRVDHIVPFSSSAGDVTLLRLVETPLTPCREGVFSLYKGPDKAPGLPSFTVMVCQSADGWQWANAEPAVSRWGALQ